MATTTRGNGAGKRRRAEGAPLTVAEAAERLNVSTTTIYEAIRGRRLAAYAIGRGAKQRRYRIEERDLLAWWSSLRVDDDAGDVPTANPPAVSRRPAPIPDYLGGD